MVTDNTPQLLRVSDICRLLKISRASLYRKLDSGEFVRPIYLGTRMPRWDSSQLCAWIAAKTKV
jgi:predicted DNA-binding transcriptional regulator AlpA